MSVDCPICQLSTEEVENISESEAKTLVAALQQKQGWCFEHIFAFTDLMKRFPFEAKVWLHEMVIGAGKLEA
jgi:ligand-binding SRPBCC domain-containing protein